MPLSRYEIRSEYSLANPDLYRAAFKDDPQGLLEGVAMAGLVGIIRQLGDMAEFAAEVFQDLHGEVLVTAARSHQLLVRVQQLETEIPLIQKMMLTENNHKKFAHNPGMDWHTHIHNDQNHFTQGDLPRFVRYAYEDCRSPPRLFLLDRFNDSGAGACLKKITDPSYFKMEWASSELMKAEKDQRDQQARRLKKKGQQQGDVDVRGESHAQCTQPRVHSEPAETKSPVSPSIRSTASDTSLGSRESDVHLSYEEDRSSMAGHGLEAKDALLTSLGFRESGVHLSYKEDSSNMAGHGLEAKDALINAGPALSAIYSPQNGIVPKAGLEVALSNGLDAEGATDDTDHFVDALATIDSEVESDSEMKMRDVADDATGVELKEVGVPVVEVNQGASASLLEDNKGEVGLEQDLSSTHQMGKETIESEDIEHAKYVDNSLVEVVKQEKISFDTSVGALKGPINDDGCLPCCEPGEVASVSSMGGLAPLVSTTPDVSVGPDENDGNPPVASQEQSDVDLQIESSLAASKTPSGPATANEGAPDSAYYTQSSPLSTRRRRWQSNELFKKEFLVSALRRTTFDDSESEQSESPNRLLSTHSSPDSIGIRPMNWATGLSRFYDTDDEMDGVQASSPSSSVSSSTLSSPRPSTLATTIFNSTWKSKPPPSLQAQVIVDLSPSPKSPGKGTMPSKPSPSVSSQPPSHPSTPMLSPDLEHPQDSINISHPEKRDAEVSVQSLDVDDQEICPPPPPLPPLAWRMSRRSVRSSRVNPSKGAACSDTTPSNKAACHSGSPFSVDVSIHSDEHSHAFTSSSAVPTVPRGSSLGLNEPPPTSTSPTSIPVPIKLAIEPEKLNMSPRTSSLGVQVVPSRSDDLSYVSGRAGSSSWHDCLSFASNRDQNPASETHRGNVDEEITSKLSENDASNGVTNVYSVEGFAGQEHVAKSHGSKLNSQHSVVAESTSLSSKSFKTVMKDARPMDFERDYPSRQASGSQDWNRIKQRSKWALTPSTASSDDREFLLEQIRSKSFSLQHTKPVKQLAPRPATNISVAAILEKANSIRQAFADSEEDDDS